MLHRSLKEIGSNLIVMEPHCHLEKITISRALFYMNIIFDTNRQGGEYQKRFRQSVSAQVVACLAVGDPGSCNSN